MKQILTYKSMRVRAEDHSVLDRLSRHLGLNLIDLITHATDLIVDESPMIRILTARGTGHRCKCGHESK